MASASSLNSAEHFLCSICLDVFTDPITTPCGHNYCKTCIKHHWDSTDVFKCPLCNKTFYQRPEVSVNKVLAELADHFKRHRLTEEYERKPEAELQQMIQQRRLKIQEVKHSVELSKKDADREIADSVQVIIALVSCIERSQAELIDVIKGKQKATEKQAEGYIKEMHQEITQLKKRSSELKKLSRSEEQKHPLQILPSINTPPPTKDWTKVNVHASSYVGSARTAVAQLGTTLAKTLSQEMEKLCDAELRRVQRYAVDITLDPDTAHRRLILSEDGKQVCHGAICQDLPDNMERFCTCVCVLGKQSFSSGRFYYEVRVKEKTDWDLGVARESINRKGTITTTPSNGYWTIVLRNGNEYWAAAGPAVPLPVREKVQTVGVFVDYEAGLVSFYDVEARVHLYSFTGCTFTEKLYPHFSPYLSNDGKNSAPLIVSPVNLPCL